MRQRYSKMLVYAIVSAALTLALVFVFVKPATI